MENVPKLSTLPNSKTCLPFVFVGDDAYGLKENMMKPYPSQNRTLEGKVFGYWLSRVRRIIENSFGIATARFRIFRWPINAKVSTVEFVTKTVVRLQTDYILHSMPAVYFNWDSSSILQLPVLGSIQMSLNAYLESNFLSDKNESFLQYLFFK